MKLLHRIVAPLASAALLAAAVAPAAAAGSQEVYRCRVLGEDSACAADAAVVTPRGSSSYVGYLMHLGMAADQAVAEARAAGEPAQAIAAAKPVPAAQGGGARAYERYLQGGSVM